MLNRLLISLVFITATSSGSAAPFEPSNQPAEQIFCYRTAQAIEHYLRLGRDIAGNSFAVAQAQRLIRSWQLGDQGLYLTAESGHPQHLGKFIPISKLLKSGLSLSTDPMVIHSADDLRFIPFSQNGTDIVLLTNAGAALDDQKAQAIVAVATRNRLRIHILWLWNNPDIWSPVEQATRLARISQLTSGHFLDLASAEPRCGS